MWAATGNVTNQGHALDPWGPGCFPGSVTCTDDCPSPAPPEVKLTPPTLNPIVSIDYLTGAKVPGKQSHSFQAGHSQDSEVAS